MAAERQKLKVVYAEDSVEADQTNTCLVCAKVIDLGGGRFGLCVRLTETKAPTCAHCRCALSFAGCNNTPRRGGFVVAACAACVRNLDVKVSTFAPVSKPKTGLLYAQKLLQETDAGSLTKRVLWPTVKTFCGSCATPDAIYDAEGKVGLATRVVTQLALQHRASDIAQALRAQPATQRRKPTLSSWKGGGGLRSGDTARAATCLPFDGRRSCYLETAGDAPLTDLDLAAEATLDRYRGAVDKSKGKDADERLLIIIATEAAEKLAATLANAPRAATRQTATRRADALAELILKRAKEKAAFEASRSPEKLAELAARKPKDALARGGISKAKQAGTDPHDGEPTVENHRTKLDDQKKKRRGKAKKRRKKARDESALDHRQAAILKKVRSNAKQQATKKRQLDDDGSGSWIACKTEGCKYHGVKKMYYGDGVLNCSASDGCGRRLRLM